MSIPFITVDALTIGWGDAILQKDASFEVNYGEIFAILGGSGCGKSTLLRYLIGLEQPMSGSIDIAGQGPPNLAVGRPPFGVMFQSGALLGSLTVGENVGLQLEQWTDLPADAVEAIVLAKLRLVRFLSLGARPIHRREALRLRDHEKREADLRRPI